MVSICMLRIKKVGLTLLFSLVLIVSFAGCNGDGGSGDVDAVDGVDADEIGDRGDRIDDADDVGDNSFDGDSDEDSDMTDAGDSSADDSDVPGCSPPCPDGSACRDLDGFGEPECVWPSGRLACVDNSHCPLDGICDFNGYCSPNCSGCFSDEDCIESNMLCIQEGGGCSTCMPIDLYSCTDDSDCAVAVILSTCCRLPVARNNTTVQNQICVEEYPYDGPVSDTCNPICEGLDHCWPKLDHPAVHCDSTICVLD